MLQYQSLEI